MRGTSEGAVLEELYCGAGNEGRRRHRAESVERLRGECFARAAFPFDRCNAQMARGAANLRKEPLHDQAALDHLRPASTRDDRQLHAARTQRGPAVLLRCVVVNTRPSSFADTWLIGRGAGRFRESGSARSWNAHSWWSGYPVPNGGCGWRAHRRRSFHREYGRCGERTRRYRVRG